jgi:hypothetical protein
MSTPLDKHKISKDYANKFLKTLVKDFIGQMCTSILWVSVGGLIYLSVIPSVIKEIYISNIILLSFLKLNIEQLHRRKWLQQKCSLFWKKALLLMGLIFMLCIIDLKMLLLTHLSKPRNCKTKVIFWVHYVVLEYKFNLFFWTEQFQVLPMAWNLCVFLSLHFILFRFTVPSFVSFSYD